MSTIALPATDEANMSSDSEDRGPQKIVLDYILKREPVFQRLAELMDKVSSRFRLSMFWMIDEEK
jgi:23S rRNA U2552 (ribose-2'-O)-methylase RlmE/FtsJ